ncbi:MAG: hypothetical protein RR450_09705 [Oscillospiraceae bacterium]
MTPITKKIRSASGSSMPLALLFLLFCLAVGGVVLTAASANAGRTARLKVEQQDYLAVQSAARLMRDELQKLEFQGSYTVTTTETPVLDDKGKPTGETKTESATSDKSGGLNEGQFRDLLSGDFTNLYRYGTQPPSHDLTITAAGMPDVNATLTVGADYSITVTLQQNENQSNLMTLKISPKKVETSGTTTTQTDTATITTTTYKTAVTYTDAVITKGGAA